MASVISVLTGRLFGTSLDELRDIVSHLCGERVARHELPDRMRQCRLHLIHDRRFAHITPTSVPRGAAAEEHWLRELTRSLGATIELPPIPHPLMPLRKTQQHERAVA